MRIRFFLMLTSLAIFSCQKNDNLQGEEDFTGYVNPFIGTDGTGHTFPGPSLPFGMVQPGPDNKNSDWAYTSGYQYRDATVLGFSQTRLSGTGIGEMGDILLLPFSGAWQDTVKNRLLKETEEARVGYYSVHKADQVRVELTASSRVAFHRYTFPGQEARVFLNFQHGLRFLTDSLVLDSKVNLENSRTLSGYCHTKNWVERTYYFVVQFDRDFQTHELLPRASKENAPKYFLGFDLGKDKQLQVKIALSTVDVPGARQNLAAEIPDWDFNRVRKQAVREWNRYLSRIRIESDRNQKVLFYTALYHLLLQPSNIADVSGKYRGADGRVAQAPDGVYYSTLSIWDIYRAAFPLLQLVAPERIDGIIHSLLIHHQAAGFLPIWTAWGQDNYCMIGNHAIPMILSAWNAGFRGFDQQAALKAMVETSSQSHVNSNWDLYNRLGYYPFDSLDNEAVSRTLESGFDDWCVAEMARQLGDSAIHRTFSRRALFYQNLFDPETRLFRGKDSKGAFRSPFDPFTATSPMNNPGDYTEANAWQYFWTPAQYDVPGMTALLGGKKAFTEKLDSFFAIPAKNPNAFLGQEAMIGQYAHGNEPGHHIAYLYAFSDNPRKGQEIVRRILETFHQNAPNGMIGNDDCGQMSAWYVLSCLGFYPVNPSTGAFTLGAPQLPRATIFLPGGKSFDILAEGLSQGKIYTEKVFLNNRRLDRNNLNYQEIRSGGKLRYQMQGAK